MINFRRKNIYERSIMKKLTLTLLSCVALINPSYALNVVPITATVCPSLIFTNTDSADTQDELNQKLQKKINALPNATRLVSVNYTNTTTLIRDFRNKLRLISFDGLTAVSKNQLTGSIGQTKWFCILSERLRELILQFSAPNNCVDFLTKQRIITTAILNQYECGFENAVFDNTILEDLIHSAVVCKLNLRTWHKIKKADPIFKNRLFYRIFRQEKIDWT